MSEREKTQKEKQSLHVCRRRARSSSCRTKVYIVGRTAGPGHLVRPTHHSKTAARSTFQTAATHKKEDMNLVMACSRMAAATDRQSFFGYACALAVQKVPPTAPVSCWCRFPVAEHT